MEALDVWQVLGKRQRAAVDGKALRGKVGREERSAGSQNSFFFFFHNNPAYVRLIQLVLLR